MEILRENVEMPNIPELNLFWENIASCGFDILFLDIETTGFHRKYSSITTIGVLHCSAYNQGEIIQFFCKNPSSEKNLLSSFIDYFNGEASFATDNDLTKKPKIVFTYNGNSFDFPYIESKCQQYYLDAPFDNIYHVDLYKLAKSCFPKEKKLSLKSLEQLLGIARTDTISGKDAVIYYKEYINTGDNSLKDLILLHNRDDIVNLISLLRLFTYDSDFILPFRSDNSNVTAYDIKVKGYALTFKLYVFDSEEVNTICNSFNKKNIRYIYNENSKVIEAELPLLSESITADDQLSMKIALVDYRSFWGLEYEDLDDSFKKLCILKTTNPPKLFMENIQEIINLSIN